MDSGIQTDQYTRSDQACQTDTPTVLSERLTMTTQTDSSEMQDCQVQVNFEPSNGAIEHPPLQAIKTENITPTIPMPNIPNSVSQTPSKKRKLSSPRPAETSTQSDFMVTDPSILNSEVYKIYCQNKDPKEAMKQIKNMKTCLSFNEPEMTMPKKEVWRKSCEKLLENLWSHGNPAKSKWEQIQAFLDGDIDEYGIFRELLPVTIDGNIEEHYIWNIIYGSFTRIKIVSPNAIEHWYVENFEGGVGVSKWYRGVGEYACTMAVLKIYGLEESVIEKYHYDFLKNKPTEKTWMEFADTFVQEKATLFLPEIPYCCCPRVDYDVKESKTCDTIVMDVTLRLNIFDYINRSTKTLKSYNGKSTRPLKKTRRPKNEKEEMTNEAKKAALIECFKDRFGFTEFKDIFIDELGRHTTA